MQQLQLKNIVFFDGHCEICNTFVKYLFKRDYSHRFLYASLQSQTARELLNEEDLKNLKSILFLKRGNLFRESRAIMEIMAILYPKTTFLISQMLPYAFYNFFYKWIALKRYSLFKKKEDIYEPSEKQKQYFLP